MVSSGTIGCKKDWHTVLKASFHYQVNAWNCPAPVAVASKLLPFPCPARELRPLLSQTLALTSFPSFRSSWSLNVWRVEENPLLPLQPVLQPHRSLWSSSHLPCSFPKGSFCLLVAKVDSVLWPFVLPELNIEGDVKMVRDGSLVEELRLVHTACKFNVERVNEVQQERNGMQLEWR